MRKYILDFIFDLNTGDSQILIDFEDKSLSVLEMNQAIVSGELREDIIEVAAQVFGPELAAQIRSGKLPLICLDDLPAEQAIKTYPPIQNSDEHEASSWTI